MTIEKNIGKADRVARIAVGIGLLLVTPLALLGPEYNWALLGFVGILPFVFGTVAYCSPYAFLDINTYAGKGGAR